jgi:hypothetical protein
MRTAEQRTAKYNARMVSSLLDPVRTAVTAEAQANFAAYATTFVPLQMKLRVELNTAGINPARFGPYEAYNGELYHLTKVCSGASLIAAAGALVGRYAHASRLGVGSAALLKSIALAIYSIVIP